MVKGYIISVSVGTGCYRHIKISENATLEQLNTIILDAFEFIDDHGHAFFLDNKIWTKTNAYISAKTAEDVDKTTDKFTLKDVHFTVGQTFKYVFDFGDEWVFQCKILRGVESNEDVPVVVRSKGEAPAQYEYENDFDDYEDDGTTDEDDEDNEKAQFDIEKYKQENQKRNAELDKKLAKPPLNKTFIDLIHPYFNAMAHLYGIIPIHEAYRIITEVYEEDVPKELFRIFVERSALYAHSYYYIEEYEQTDTFNYLLVSDGFEDDEIDDLLSQHEGKSYYLPEKETFLKYGYDFFYEKDKYFTAMFSFFKSMPNTSDERADDLADEMQLMAYMGETDINHILGDLERMRAPITSQAKIKRFLDVYFDLMNHTRQQVNKGFTPAELSGNVVEFAKEVKVGRNEPCPCGSGNKYKKCCGR